MVKRIHYVGSFVVAVGLAVPALAEAQAIPRTSSGSSSSSGSSGSSGSTSSGGGGGGGVSGGSGRTSVETGSSSSGSSGVSFPTISRGSGESYVSPSKTSPPKVTSQSQPPAPGAISVSKASAVETPAVESSSNSARSRVVGSIDPSTSGLYTGRTRGASPIAGTATARPDSDFVSFPLFGPWGRWFPWFTGGFGWNTGFVDYNPWSYGATSWMWGRYGFWYDPFAYYWDPSWYSASSYGNRKAPEKVMTGSLRIKASPENANVYIDKALVGSVDEFNGLTNHLEVDAGKHQIELRAEGYATLVKDITVAAGKTQTIRLSMKKSK